MNDAGFFIAKVRESLDEAFAEGMSFSLRLHGGA
jgi:hypothetical protein